LNLKADTYAVESTIHFPTDINLLWDSVRKCLDVVALISKEITIRGWRKLNHWQKTMKKVYRRTANIHQKKGMNYQRRLEVATRQYLDKSKDLATRIELTLESIKEEGSLKLTVLKIELEYYKSMLDKYRDLLGRRILKGEIIPHAEKVFSIFEPHVEWLQKGKQNKKVELGHNTLITTDQFHFIVDHKVLIGEPDSSQPMHLTQRLKTRFTAGYQFMSISFDRGFYSVLAKQNLEQDFCQVVMPKKGKKTAWQEEQELNKSFVAYRNKHSAVESNINELEHSGVNKVPDKGLHGFKNYVAMGVLAYNIKRLGILVIEQNLLSTIQYPTQIHTSTAA
jgi:transposase, IS5 family